MKWIGTTCIEHTLSVTFFHIYHLMLYTGTVKYYLFYFFWWKPKSREMSRLFTQGHMAGKCRRRIWIQNYLTPKNVAPWLPCHSQNSGRLSGRLLINTCSLIDESRQNHLTLPKLPAIEPWSGRWGGEKSKKEKEFPCRGRQQGHLGWFRPDITKEKY